MGGPERFQPLVQGLPRPEEGVVAKAQPGEREGGRLHQVPLLGPQPFDGRLEGQAEQGVERGDPREPNWDGAGNP
jgi:hypothetical protein